MGKKCPLNIADALKSIGFNQLCAKLSELTSEYVNEYIFRVCWQRKDKGIFTHHGCHAYTATVGLHCMLPCGSVLFLPDTSLHVLEETRRTFP